MGFYRGPNLVTSGMVLSLDAGNIKSFPGEPTTNLHWSLFGLNGNFENGSIGGWAFDAKTDGTAEIWSGETYEGNYCVRLKNSTVNNIAFWDGDINVTGGTYYTISCYAKNISCPTVPYFSGVNMSGFFNFTGINNSWQRFTYSFLTLSTGAADFYIRTAPNAIQGYFLIDNFMVEQKPYVTPFVNTIRSGTNAWLDLTSYNNNGNLVNNVTYDSNYFGSLYFDGFSGYTALGNPVSLQNLYDGTLSIWFYRSVSGASYQMLFTDPTSAMEISFNGATDIQFYVGNSSLTISPLIPNTHAWTNVVGTFSKNGNFKRIYINGILKNSGTNSSGSGNLYNRSIGARYASYYFNGKISNVGVYNRALSDSEVLQNYNSLRWRYEERIVNDGLVLNLDAGKSTSYPGSGTVWTDLSGKGNNGTLSGVTYSSANAGSLVFNGVNNQVTIVSSTSLNFPSVPFTVNMWVKVPASLPASSQVLYAKGTNGFCVYFYNNLLYFGKTNISDWATVNVSSYLGLNLNISVGWNGTNKFCYLNSTQAINTLQSTYLIESTSVISSIGALYNGTYFAGSVYTIQIYNRALSLSEISQNYNALLHRFV